MADDDGSTGRLRSFGAATLARLPQLTTTAIAGLLLCASFPPLNWWWAAVLAFALLAAVLTRPATTVAGGFGYGFLFGLAFYLPLLPWVSDLVGSAPWVVLAVMCALFPALFALLAVVVRTLPGWPVWFALLWAAQEWAKSIVPFGGFPWGIVGFSQTGGPFLPLVSLGGVALLSAAIVLLGCAATALAREIWVWLRREDAAAAPPAVVVPGLCICLVLLGVVVVWPGVRQSGMGAGSEPTIAVAAVQGNVPRLGLDFNAQRREVLEYHVKETLRLADDVRAGRAPQPQFVIWPENSSDIDPVVNVDAGQLVARAAQAIGAPILVGTIRTGPHWTPENPEASNTVLVWDPVSGPADWHDKRIIQPFGEYLPWRDFFRHLSSYADRAGHFVPGHGDGVVHAGGVPVGVATCWEVIFDRAPRQSVLAGAQLLAVPTNNATFDASMSRQQLAFAKVRAVEHDRYVVVAGTTGISAVIAPDGHELGRTDFFEAAYLDFPVRLKTDLTPATRWGPLLQWLLVAAAGAAVIAAVLHNWRRRGQAQDSGADEVPSGESESEPARSPDQGAAQ